MFTPAFAFTNTLTSISRYLVRTLPGQTNPKDYVLSVVFRGVCTHHRLLIRSPDSLEGGLYGSELNNTPIPGDIHSLEAAIEFLSSQRTEPLWPLSLTTRVRGPSEVGEDTRTSAPPEKGACDRRNA